MKGGYKSLENLALGSPLLTTQTSLLENQQSQYPESTPKASEEATVKVNPSWFETKIKEVWDPRNDAWLYQLAREKFENWKVIAKIASAKFGSIVTPFFVKQRVLPMMRQVPKKKKGEKFSEEEDELLVKFVQNLGREWVQISDEMGFNNPVKVKNRYYNIMRRKGKPKNDENSESQNSFEEE